MADDNELPKRIFHSPEWQQLVADEEAARIKVSKPVDRTPLTTEQINELAHKYRERQQQGSTR